MKHLEYILAVAEEQNITRAAERLYISQPVLTRFLNNLEAEYGVTLFERTQNPVKLTEAGKLFVREQTQIALKEQALRERMKAMANQKVSLRVGSGRNRGNDMFPPVLNEFLQRHPQTDISVVLTGELSLTKLLERGQLDLAMGAFEIEDASLEQRELQQERMALFVPTSFGIFEPGTDIHASFRRPIVIEPSLLDKLPVVISDSSLGSYNSYRILMAQFSLSPSRVITVNNATLLRELALRGLGYAFCSISDRVIRALENSRRSDGSYPVAVCTFPGLPVVRRTILVWRRNHPERELLEELAGMLFDRAVRSADTGREP